MRRRSAAVVAVAATAMGLVSVPAASRADTVPPDTMPPDTMPANCGPPDCLIDSNIFGYLPPVATIDSGTVVRWASSDAPHPTAEGFPPADPCFRVPVGPGVDLVPVRFDVVDGALHATTSPGTAEEETGLCESAIVLGAGQTALEYRCLLHPWMFGTLVVDAPTPS